MDQGLKYISRNRFCKEFSIEFSCVNPIQGSSPKPTLRFLSYNIEWRAFHRLLILRQGWLLCLMALTAGRFLDLVHEFPGTSYLVQYLLDLLIKEYVFGTFHHFLKLFPIYQASRWLVFLQIPATIYILPAFRVPRDADNFLILFLSLING